MTQKEEINTEELGEKIVKSVKERTTLNLDTGFQTAFINMHNSLDYKAKPYNMLWDF